MAINYTTLTGVKTVSGSIANWVNRDDLPTTDILTEAELYIYQYLRVREMQSSNTIAISASANTANLPSDFLDPIRFRLYGYSTDLPYVAEHDLKDNRDESGTLFSGSATQWAIRGTTLYVDVNVATATTGILWYFAQPAALSGSNETNFLTTRYPTLLRRACLKYAFEHMKDDERMSNMETLTRTALQEANATNEIVRRGQY